MPNLPLARYTGEETECAEDHDGKKFWAYQGPNNQGCVVMERAGAYTVLPYKCTGRPSLEHNPLVGLWLIGNQEVPALKPPPRTPIKEYVAWPALPQAPPRPALVIPASSALWQVYKPDYAVPSLDTAEELTLRFNKLKAGYVALVDALVSAGLLVRGS